MSDILHPDSQAAAILKHLQAGGTITPLLALEKFGCMRLGARILDLKHKGHVITSTPVKTDTGKIIAEYRLQQPDSTPPTLPL